MTGWIHMTKVLKVVTEERVGYTKAGDAGIDMKASGEWVIDLDSTKRAVVQDAYPLEPGERILCKTGLRVEIPAGYWGHVIDRSGLALKNGLHIMAGVIDETYRGELGIVIINLGKKPYEIKKGDRIAQMVVMPYTYLAVRYVKEDDLTQTDRKSEGFGQSGR